MQEEQESMSFVVFTIFLHSCLLVFQGNGHERDFCHLSNVYVMDVYNSRVYPRDHEAKAGIQCKIELDPFTSDFEYLDLVEM